MVKITGLKASPSQTFSINDPNGGGPISFVLHYYPRVESWYADITFGSFILKGYHLLFSPDALAQFFNRVPFGLAVITTDGLDPFLINDFTSGRVTLYLLTTAEKQAIADDIQSGTLTA